VGAGSERLTTGKPLIADRFYEYSIGNHSLAGMDAAFLYVHLDKDSHVVTVEIYGY
jgi:hypothetical protein